MPLPDRWWTRLPLANSLRPTDVCATCGHVRALHHQWAFGAWTCSAMVGCGCGPMTYPFHVAGLPVDEPRDTITHKGHTLPLSQPRAPGKPIASD